MKFNRAWLVFSVVLLQACSTLHKPEAAAPEAVAPPVPAVAALAAPKPHKIALVLGGGATKGFAHVGVIKGLEANQIFPDMIVGTSAGSVVGALYAAGYSAADLEKISTRIEEGEIRDWSFPDRGIFKGEALQDFVNKAVGQRPLEKLKYPFAVITTDLHTGEQVVFQTGNTGMAVRASSAVPGVFQPVLISGHEYVDGGLVSPVPVEVARKLGADFVIAVDVSDSPVYNKTDSTVEVMLQTFTIMGQTIRRYELAGADILIRPQLNGIGTTNFDDRISAIQDGENAVKSVLPELKDKLQKLR